MTDIMTKQDVMKDFKLTKGTVDYLVTTGQIPFIRMGKRRVRFSRKSLEQWLKERENVKVQYDKN